MYLESIAYASAREWRNLDGSLGTLSRLVLGKMQPRGELLGAEAVSREFVDGPEKKNNRTRPATTRIASRYGCLRVLRFFRLKVVPIS